MIERNATHERTRPWAMSPDAVMEQLTVTHGRGLDDAEVKKRRRRHEPNSLKEAKRRSTLRVLFDQFKSLLVVLLALAAVVATGMDTELGKISASIRRFTSSLMSSPA